MSGIFEKFKRDIIGVLWGAGALFLGLSLLSFNPTDPSFNSVSKITDGPAKAAANLCGFFGSFLSDFLYRSLGIASWTLVILAVVKSFGSFRGVATPLSKQRVFLGALFVLLVASLLGLYAPEAKFYENEISASGVLGLSISQGLVTLLNKVGVGIILWSSLLILTVFLSEKRLTDWPLKIPGLESLKKLKIRWAEKKVKTEILITTPPKNDRFSFNREKPKVVHLPDEHPERARPRTAKPPIKQFDNWSMPNLDLLIDPPRDQNRIDEREISRNAKLVEQKLAEFDVFGQVVEVKPGPAVTMYEFKPAASTKITDITKLNDDLSLALSAESLRIIAPIPGRDVVGIETSNNKRNSIYMRELLESQEFWNDDIKLPIALGKTVSGEPKVIDLRKIPHLLVAGTTGSGKSVFIMSLVTGFIMRHSPKTLKLIIVDPKQVDLAAFHKIPHLLMPPVKDSKPAVNTLKWLIREMEKRYRSMSRFNSKNIEGFNNVVQALPKEEMDVHRERVRVFEENPQTHAEAYYYEPQPYIVAVIEEFADLMSVDRNGVEPTVVRLAQMARASGIHLVIAMQSPRREVLTGLIKTNFPGRISFKVASKIDSSIVLDQRGAERLLSVGDMLYLAPGVSQPQRYHGAFLRDEEMNAVAEFWTKQGEPQFNHSAVLSLEEKSSEEFFNSDYAPDKEEGYDEVVAYVTGQKEVSASLLQRRFRFGYPKAARIIELLESEGIVGPPNGSKPRVVLAQKIG